MTIPSAPFSIEGGVAPLKGPHGPIGVLVCGHGSRNRLAVEEFASLARQLQHNMGRVPVEYGYLEFARPILRDGLDALRQRGVSHVLAIPAMLFAAGSKITFSAWTSIMIFSVKPVGADSANCRSVVCFSGASLPAFKTTVSLALSIRTCAVSWSSAVIRPAPAKLSALKSAQNSLSGKDT